MGSSSLFWRLLSDQARMEPSVGLMGRAELPSEKTKDWVFDPKSLHTQPDLEFNGSESNYCKPTQYKDCSPLPLAIYFVFFPAISLGGESIEKNKATARSFPIGEEEIRRVKYYIFQNNPPLGKALSYSLNLNNPQLGKALLGVPGRAKDLAKESIPFEMELIIIVNQFSCLLSLVLSGSIWRLLSISWS